MTPQKDKLPADLKARHEYHKKLVVKKTLIFKWMGYVMVLAIPIPTLPAAPPRTTSEDTLPGKPGASPK